MILQKIIGLVIAWCIHVLYLICFFSVLTKPSARTSDSFRVFIYDSTFTRVLHCARINCWRFERVFEGWDYNYLKEIWVKMGLGLETWRVETEMSAVEAETFGLSTEMRPWIGLETISRPRCLSLGPIPAKYWQLLSHICKYVKLAAVYLLFL